MLQEMLASLTDKYEKKYNISMKILYFFLDKCKRLHYIKVRVINENIYTIIY